MKTHEKDLLLSLLETTISKYSQAQEFNRNYMSRGKPVAQKTEDKLGFEPISQAPDMIAEGSALACEGALGDAAEPPKMRLIIKIWKTGRILYVFSPEDYAIEEDFLGSLADLQKNPDEEFHMKVECCGRAKSFICDGSDGILVVGALLYKGMEDLVFSLDLPRFTCDYDIEENGKRNIALDK